MENQYCGTLLLHIIYYIIVISNYKTTLTKHDSPRRYSRGELVHLNESLHA